MIGAPFSCNVCGASNIFDPGGDWREAPSCAGCGSSVRTRQLVHCLTKGLLGASCALDEADGAAFRGIGLSDPEVLANALGRRFAYTNSFYHQEPRLDICAPARAWRGTADFLISSDVFEHVPPPVQRAFDGAARVLRPGGLLILTVPFDERAATTEHFPDLHRFRIAETEGGWVLANYSRDGRIQVHDRLVFHGGPGSTLEMRFFGRQDLLDSLARAGFTDIRVHAGAVPRWGIFPPHEQGLPITARRHPSIFARWGGARRLPATAVIE